MIPAEALTRMERDRKCQALVPDFRLELPCATGGTKTQLAELKVISCCPSQYHVAPPPPRPGRDFVRAVERRARTLTAEYLKKAREVDRVYGNVPEGEVGRVERKLTGYGQVRGLVFGAFGEASGGVHELVQRLGETRVKAVGIQQGRETVKGEMGVIVG